MQTKVITPGPIPGWEGPICHEAMEGLQYEYLDPLSEFRLTTLTTVADKFGAIPPEGPAPRLPHAYVWCANLHFRVGESTAALWFPAPIDGAYGQQPVALYYREPVDQEKLTTFLKLFTAALLAAHRGENEFAPSVRLSRPLLWTVTSAILLLLAVAARRYVHI